MTPSQPEPANDEAVRRRWSDLGAIVTAHVIMLRDAGILDDAGLAVLLTPLDAALRGRSEGARLSEQVAAFDERVDALVPAGMVGATTIARGRLDSAAAAARLATRRALLDLLRATEAVRLAAIEVALAHAATTMPAFVAGQAAQPTTFGHYLGGVLGPLARASTRLEQALAEVDLSPLGAVALASTSLPIERERVAALLGFAGLIENTFDAVAATDHLVTAADAGAAVAVALWRFLADLLVWLRAEPESFRLGDDWIAVDPGLPQARLPVGIERLIDRAAAAESEAAAVKTRAQQVPFAPLGARLDPILDSALAALATATEVAEGCASLLAQGMEVNRAYLANRAGRAFSTGSDLATFLMTAEGLDPAAAANIAMLTISRARAEGVEASGITTQMIDAAALLVIGRELAVEFEEISRHLAPRRFLERRNATGGPAPAALRSSLDSERARLDAAVRRRLEVEARHLAAERERERIVAETLAEAAR